MKLFHLFFSHASRMAVGMAMSVRWLVHLFGLTSRSTIIKWNALKFCTDIYVAQRMNTKDSSDP